jgi:hypothetical protein
MRICRFGSPAGADVFDYRTDAAHVTVTDFQHGLDHIALGNVAYESLTWICTIRENQESRACKLQIFGDGVYRGGMVPSSLRQNESQMKPAAIRTRPSMMTASVIATANSDSAPQPNPVRHLRFETLLHQV